MNSSSSRYPFTPSQWQELEQQALIYKYMASGMSIPSDLLLPIKRSFFFMQPATTPNLGWSNACYHQIGAAGYGVVGRRGADDPEPGRCRRTDGKKWRCSKEAHAESKYCERHMHRGKNRSRKPVEISLNSLASTTNNSSTSVSSIGARSPYPLLYPQPLAEPRQREGEEGEKERGRHCFVLGADFGVERPVKERDFFSFDAGEINSSSRSNQASSSTSSYSKAHLSISIPMGLLDFPQIRGGLDWNK